MLRFTYDPEDEWHGQLTCRASCTGFSGEGSAWFSKEDLRDFCVRLGDYPLQPDRLPRLAGGYGDSVDRLDETHLAILIAPYDVRGTLRVRVELATPASETHEKDVHQEARLQFLTHYADIARFRSSFAAMLDDGVEAILGAPAS